MALQVAQAEHIREIEELQIAKEAAELKVLEVKAELEETKKLQ